MLDEKKFADEVMSEEELDQIDENRTYAKVFDDYGVIKCFEE